MWKTRGVQQLLFPYRFWGNHLNLTALRAGVCSNLITRLAAHFSGGRSAPRREFASRYVKCPNHLLVRRLVVLPRPSKAPVWRW
jgi:hypothetical protein